MHGYLYLDLLYNFYVIKFLLYDISIFRVTLTYWWWSTLLVMCRS